MATKKKNKPSRLAELANFRLVLRQFLAFSEAASEGRGIHTQHYQLLQVIAAAASIGLAVPISLVSERMMLRHNSAVELIDRAGKAGLVERVADASDHRRRLLVLTAVGEKVLFELVSEHLEYLKLHGVEMADALRRVTN